MFKRSGGHMSYGLAPVQCTKPEQEIMKVREVIPHTGPIPIVIPLKLFLDLLRESGIPTRVN